MKIAIVTDYFQPTFGWQEYYLAREFSEVGRQVLVLTSDRHAPHLERNRFAKRILGDRRVGSSTIPQENFWIQRLPCIEYKPAQKVILRGLKSALKSFKPDIIQGEEVFSLTAYQLALYRRELGCHLFYDSHASSFDTNLRDTPLKQIFMYFYQNLIMPKIKSEAKKIVAITESSQVLICREFFLKPKEVPIIRLGVDLKLFKFDKYKREQIRKKLKVRNDEVLVIFPGRISPDKNIDLLIKSIARLAKSGKKMKLLIIGPGEEPYLSELKKEAESIRKNIIFHQPVPHQELTGFYSAADIGVWPRNLSLTIMQAMACNLPVVLAKVISENQPSDYLLTNKNGLSFTCGNVQELTKCIDRLTDANLRREMGKRSRELVEREFGWKMIANKFLALYKEVI